MAFKDADGASECLVYGVCGTVTSMMMHGVGGLYAVCMWEVASCDVVR